MQVVVGPRRYGKTTAVAGWARMSGGIIFTHSEQEAERVRREHKLPKWQVRTLHSFEPRGFGSYTHAVFDNADMILSELVKMPVDGITVTELKAADWIR